MEHNINRAHPDESPNNLRVDEKVSYYTQEKVGISLVQGFENIDLDKKQALELKTLIENIWG